MNAHDNTYDQLSTDSSWVLPSNVGKDVTWEVGLFACNYEKFTQWLLEGLGDNWHASKPEWTSFADAIDVLRPAPELNREACIDINGWTLLPNNTPLGTDPGMLPSRAAEELDCLGIRAACIDKGDTMYPARILEVYGPGSIERSIVAANDGGKWVFDTYGKPFDFENQEAYANPRISDRLTASMVHQYLRELQVPIDTEPSWHNAILLEKSRES